jgi:hypothetical protein
MPNPRIAFESAAREICFNCAGCDDIRGDTARYLVNTSMAPFIEA